MSTLTKPDLSVGTTVSGYDQLQAILISCIMLFGFLTTVLFLLWLTTLTGGYKPEPVIVVDILGDDGDEKPEGVADDVLEPGVEDFPEVETPQLAAALEAVTDAVSSVRASLEKRSGEASQMGKGRGSGSRDGGPGGGNGGIPDYKRWNINYESEDIDTYAKQLDFFKIDIGVVSTNTDAIQRVTNLASSPKLVPSSRAKEAKTLRFAHIKQRMRQWDQELARRAGASLENTALVQFYPPETRQMIRQREAAALKDAGRDIKQVLKTNFKVINKGGQFVFDVVEISYKN